MAINNAVVYDGQLIKQDPFKGEYVFDFNSKSPIRLLGTLVIFGWLTDLKNICI